MQGWRISMEDAHACILDLQATVEGKPTPEDKRLAFFGVYDGHGGDKVAIYTGEHLHEIVAKQEAFKEGDIKKALQDGFLATDRAILSGTSHTSCHFTAHIHADSFPHRPEIRRRGLWLHSICRRSVQEQDLRCEYTHMEFSSNTLTQPGQLR